MGDVVTEMDYRGMLRSYRIL